MKILQIMSANGWRALYDKGSFPGSFHHARPLICWALVELEDGLTEVIGMETDEDMNVALFTPTHKNFVKYHFGKAL